MMRPQITHEEIIRDMDEYIEYLKTLSPEEARTILIRTGVLDKDGNPKENIVSCANPDYSI